MPAAEADVARTDAERSWEALRAAAGRGHPPFLKAIVADAQVTSFYRGERFDPDHPGRAALRTLRLAWVSDAFFAQVLYRLGARLRSRRIPILPRLMQGLTMAIAQMSIDYSVLVRPGVSFSHGHVVIGGVTEIRGGTLISPFVSIGLVAGDIRGPIIGPRTVVGTGARILGPVSIGARSRIGANAVVLIDVPDDGVAVGVPAKVVGE